MVNESRVSIRLPVDSHLDNSGAFNDRSGSRFDRGMISGNTRVYPNGRLHISRVLALSTRGGDISASCLPQNYYNTKYPELEISWIATVSSEIKRSQHTNEIDGKRDEWGIIFFDNSILLKKKSFVIRLKCILIGKMELFYWIYWIYWI